MVRARWMVLIYGAVLANAAVAQNLVVNPDFTAGLEGWSLYSDDGHVFANDADGFPSPPSMRVTGASSITGAAVATSCIAIDDTGTFDLSFNVNAIAGQAMASVVTYADADCTMQVASVSSDAFDPISIWRVVSVPSLALTGSGARIVLVANPAPTGGRGDAQFDHVAFGPHGTLGQGIDITQEGLSGAWYNPLYTGQGFQFAIGAGSLFGAWYTFGDTSGGPETQRWYSLQGPLAPGATHADLTIYRNTSGNFDAPPSTAANAVGTGTLTFDSCTSGTFTYAFDAGATGEVEVRSLLPNVECVETGTPTHPPSDFGLSGTWYDPTTGGQGFLVNVNPVDAQVFVGWYTYALHDTTNGDIGQRWFSAQGPYRVGNRTMLLDLFVSTGATFMSFGSISTVYTGNVRLEFQSCSSATLTYEFTDGDFAGQSRTITLSRLGPAPQSCDF